MSSKSRKLFQPASWPSLPERLYHKRQRQKMAQRLAASGLFETTWYQVENPDIAQAKIDCLWHYIHHGVAEGRDPNPFFDTDWYLAQYPDVAETDINPLLHYVQWGVQEGRDPSPFFDTDWYLAQNPDVAAADLNPLLHYLQCGGLEGRDPNPYFDSDWYRVQNPDVVKAQINPLLHYLYQGVVEGRSPSSTNDVQFIQQVASYHAALKVSPREAFAAAIAARQERQRPQGWKRWLLELSNQSQQFFDRVIRRPDTSLASADAAEAAPSDSSSDEAAQAAALSLVTTQLVPKSIAIQTDGRYTLADGPPQYTYIPPAPPDDLPQQLAAMTVRPQFSIVVPIYNTPPDLLTEMVDSVVQQWYPDWELILVDDASPLPETRAALEALSHPQINVHYSAKNAGIAGATNAAIAQATGDYIVFLDHDDELTPDCLYELSRCINRDDPDFIYSDEDKINDQAGFQEPHFKPDWSPDTMMSTMYTCHVSCVRKSLVDRVGGLRTECNGCQDWDFILRVTELTQNIHHIPKVLYHWRIIPGSTAADIAAKSYILAASQRVRKDALARRGIAGKVEAVPQVSGYFRVVYDLVNDPLISIVVRHRGDELALSRCLRAIATTSAYPKLEVIVVSPAPIPPGSQASLQALVGEQIPLWWVQGDASDNSAQLRNLGARQAHGNLLLFLDDGLEVTQVDWLERLGGWAQRSHIGAVGAKLLCPQTKKVQHGGIVNLAHGPTPAGWGQHPDDSGYFMRNLLEYNWLAVSGACLMIERAKFERVQGFAEAQAIAHNDIDLCLRLYEQGFYHVVCPAVHLLTHDVVLPAPYTPEEQQQSVQTSLMQLYERHPQYFQYDPFHSPNLHPAGFNFEYFCSQ